MFKTFHHLILLHSAIYHTVFRYVVAIVSVHSSICLTVTVMHFAETLLHSITADCFSYWVKPLKHQPQKLTISPRVILPSAVTRGS